MMLFFPPLTSEEVGILANQGGTTGIPLVPLRIEDFFLTGVQWYVS